MRVDDVGASLFATSFVDHDTDDDVDLGAGHPGGEFVAGRHGLCLCEFVAGMCVDVEHAVMGVGSPVFVTPSRQLSDLCE